MLLMYRTGGTATSRAMFTSRCASFSSTSGATTSPSRVNPTRSANAIVTNLAPGRCRPSARSVVLTASVSTACNSCTRSMSSISGPSIGATTPMSASDAFAVSSSVAPGLVVAPSAAARITSAARVRPSASTCTTSTIWSGANPNSRNCLHVGERVPVDPRENGRVGILHAWQPDGALQPLQQLDVDAVLLADLAGGHQGPVVAECPSRRQQHRRERIADLLGGEATGEQPLDQLGAFGTRLALEPIEQSGSFDVDGFGHRVNVYRAPPRSPGPSTMPATWTCPRDAGPRRRRPRETGTACRAPARRTACAVATSRRGR